MDQADTATSKPLLVRAKFAFRGKNNDELCFRKGDLITVTQAPQDGNGWWEGTLGDKTAWFPSNYVTQVEDAVIRGKGSKAAAKALQDASESQGKNTKASYRAIVLNDIIQSEMTHLNELKVIFRDILQPLRGRDSPLTRAEHDRLCGNFEPILRVHEALSSTMEAENMLPSNDQKVGGHFLQIAPEIKTLLSTYCENHPLAIQVIDDKREALTAFLQKTPAGPVQLRTLIAGLSKPFRHLEKYAGSLAELERNMEESHADRGDTQRAVAVYRDLANMFTQDRCVERRRERELFVQLKRNAHLVVEGWSETHPEIQDLGDIIHMGPVSVMRDSQSFGEDSDFDDRCLAIFERAITVLAVGENLDKYKLHELIPMNDSHQLTLHRFTSKNILALKSLQNTVIAFKPINPNNKASVLQKWADALLKSEFIELDKNSHMDKSSVSPGDVRNYEEFHVEASPSQKPLINDLPKPSHLESSIYLPDKSLQDYYESSHDQLYAQVKKPGSGKMSNGSLPGKLDHELQMFAPDGDFGSSDILTSRPTALTVDTFPPQPRTKLFSGYALRPLPSSKGNFVLNDVGNTAEVRMRNKGSMEEVEPGASADDAMLVRLVEAYCGAAPSASYGANAPNSGFNTPGIHAADMSSSVLPGANHNDNHVATLLAEDEKIFVEELVDGNVVFQEKSLVDTVYAMRDQIKEMNNEITSLRKSVEREQRQRRKLEEVIRKQQL